MGVGFCEAANNLFSSGIPLKTRLFDLPANLKSERNAVSDFGSCAWLFRLSGVWIVLKTLALPDLMKRRTLILLTKQFPFLQKEQYVAHELKYLAAAFEKVFIYPHDYFGSEQQVSFDLPPNVQVINLNRSIQPAPKVEVVRSLAGALFYEYRHTYDRSWLTRDIKRLISIYAAQYALGNGLVRWMSENNIDRSSAVFYSYWFSNAALCLAILKRRNLIPSFVSRAHSLDLYHEDWGLINEVILIPPFRHFKQRYVETIYTISDHGTKYLKQKFPSLSVKTAYLGVDDYGLNPGKDSDVPVIVTCSGFDENKRLHLLGRSLSRINKRVKWIHFGDGALREEAVNSVNSPQVEFIIKGQTSNSDIRRFYAENHIDLFVNVSLVEGLPVTIMEALSHGIPVLATSVNGTPEAVREGFNGFLLPSGFTDHDIDAVLSDALHNHHALHNMRIASRQLYENAFCAASNYQDFAAQIG
jgi:glycosyltransferase involved in cell wall biosynthesis